MPADDVRDWHASHFKDAARFTEVPEQVAASRLLVTSS
jgi:hypothetical protein